MVARHFSCEGCPADNWRYQKTTCFWMPDGSFCAKVARAKQKHLKTHEFSYSHAIFPVRVVQLISGGIKKRCVFECLMVVCVWGLHFDKIFLGWGLLLLDQPRITRTEICGSWVWPPQVLQILPSSVGAARLRTLSVKDHVYKLSWECSRMAMPRAIALEKLLKGQ